MVLSVYDRRRTPGKRRHQVCLSGASGAQHPVKVVQRLPKLGPRRREGPPGAHPVGAQRPEAVEAHRHRRQQVTEQAPGHQGSRRAGAALGGSAAEPPPWPPQSGSSRRPVRPPPGRPCSRPAGRSVATPCPAPSRAPPPLRLMTPRRSAPRRCGRVTGYQVGSARHPPHQPREQHHRCPPLTHRCTASLTTRTPWGYRHSQRDRASLPPTTHAIGPIVSLREQLRRRPVDLPSFRRSGSPSSSRWFPQSALPSRSDTSR